MHPLVSDNEYKLFLTEIKQQYRASQLKAAFSVNTEMICFYWNLGGRIIEKQKNTTWGSKFLEQLSVDLRREFPGTQGFSVRNLQFMRQFATLYSENEFAKQAVSQLPWGHIILLMQQVKDSSAREWYAQNTLKNGTARGVLMMQIEQNLYERQGIDAHKITNFVQTLPKPQSDLAQQLFKDPYDFRFLPVTNEADEQKIEQALVKDIQKLFLEFGKGFAFMGNQYQITVGESDFFFDMLFYNVYLHCYFVLEIKAVEFKPEHAGKLNFYLAAADRYLKSEKDNASIGLLLCKKKDRTVAELALTNLDGAMGIAEYKLPESLPHNVADVLPPQEALAALSLDVAEDKEK